MFTSIPNLESSSGHVLSSVFHMGDGWELCLSEREPKSPPLGCLFIYFLFLFLFVNLTQIGVPWKEGTQLRNCPQKIGLRSDLWGRFPD